MLSAAQSGEHTQKDLADLVGLDKTTMVVTVDGTTNRPDGSTYHITWSLSSGRKARESNDVIRERGWSPIDPPVPVKLEPARF